jgi:hypothetical protein
VRSRSRNAAVILAVSIGLGPLAALLAAQEKPDFSGQWVLVSARKSNNSVAREMTVSHTPNEPDSAGGMLHIERRFENSRSIESESLPVGVRSGTVNGISPGSIQAFVSSRMSVTWNGNRLMIEKSSYSGPGTAAQHIEEWSLPRKNTLLITMTDRIGGSLQPKTATVIYRRR